MSGDVFCKDTIDEKVYITQHEQKEYDSCSWENEEFGKIDLLNPSGNCKTTVDCKKSYNQ